nr:hypothetical protein [Candidatus Saccharibacteria bacterium]
MPVDQKNEEEYTALTHGYSPTNYSVLKIRGQQIWLKRLSYVAFGFVIFLTLFGLYMQSLCLDTWYTNFFTKFLHLSNTCNDLSSKVITDSKLSFKDGVLTLTNGTSVSSVTIPSLIPGAPLSLISKNGQPGQSGANGSSGAAGVSSQSGAAGPAGPAGSGGFLGVVNDVNVTGSLAASVLTLGWNGELAPNRGGVGVDGSTAPNGSLLIGNGTGY